MDRFATLPASERAVYFEQTASRKNLSPWIIEKDFWVCWMLGKLFSLPGIGGNLTFKGGTSLSKVYGIIGRFSEDIDVSIEREFLGFHGENSPEAAKSGKETRRRLDALSAACRDFIRIGLVPALRQAISDGMGDAETCLLNLTPVIPTTRLCCSSIRTLLSSAIAPTFCLW